MVINKVLETSLQIPLKKIRKPLMTKAEKYLLVSVTESGFEQNEILHLQV